MSHLLDAAAQRDPQRRKDLAREDKLLDVTLELIELQALECAQLREVRTAHLFHRIGGTGLDDAIVSTCTCGWKGRPVEGWRDSQATELAAQEYQHRMGSVDDMRAEGLL